MGLTGLGSPGRGGMAGRLCKGPITDRGEPGGVLVDGQSVALRDHLGVHEMHGQAAFFSRRTSSNKLTTCRALSSTLRLDAVCQQASLIDFLTADGSEKK